MHILPVDTFTHLYGEVMSYNAVVELNSQTWRDC